MCCTDFLRPDSASPGTGAQAGSKLMAPMTSAPGRRRRTVKSRIIATNKLAQIITGSNLFIYATYLSYYDSVEKRLEESEQTKKASIFC